MHRSAKKKGGMSQSEIEICNNYAKGCCVGKKDPDFATRTDMAIGMVPDAKLTNG